MAVAAKAVSTTVAILSAGGASKSHVSVSYTGASPLYVIADSADPSANLHTVTMGDGYVTYWEPPGESYRGEVRGVLASGTGTAMVTEY